VRFLKKEYLDRTHAFYEKHGGKTIILARFVPSCAPSPPLSRDRAMTYGKFITTTSSAGLPGRALHFPGYFFGSLPFVQDNFSLWYCNHHHLVMRPCTNPERGAQNAAISAGESGSETAISE